MIQGTYYKEWSRVLGRDMEFKVYGTAGVPVLALPARGGRFYDWENNGMPDAIAQLLNEGKVQLFCADSIDGEAVLNGDIPVRRRAEMEEKYFVYLTAELAPRVLALNEAEKDTKLWCVGIDLGAVHAVNCRLRRPQRRLLPCHRRPGQPAAGEREHHRTAGCYRDGAQQDRGDGRGRHSGKIRPCTQAAY